MDSKIARGGGARGSADGGDGKLRWDSRDGVLFGGQLLLGRLSAGSWPVSMASICASPGGVLGAGEGSRSSRTFTIEGADWWLMHLGGTVLPHATTL